ncbi:MAG: 50S ribosomal protein L11 methyltransferase [Cocleimonas sp.]
MSEQRWLQLVCHTQENSVEAIESAMEDSNVLSITMQDKFDTPVLEPLPGELRLWKDLIITALFDYDTDLAPLTELLEENTEVWNIDKFIIETVEDQDWERVWMKDFHPMKFGENLWIYPSNHEIPEDDSVKILLDPGLAFGTGTHPTTSLCLEWLDQNPPKDQTVIDYGCGSGILALAAAKLGATKIIATDIDPQALTATNDNMQRNDIAADMIPCYLPEDCPTEAVDLLLANILCGPLNELFPLFSSLTKSSGKLVMSGLLAEQQQQIIDTYSADFKDFDVKQLGDWVRISAIKMG